MFILPHLLSLFSTVDCRYGQNIINTSSSRNEVLIAFAAHVVRLCLVPSGDHTMRIYCTRFTISCKCSHCPCVFDFSTMHVQASGFIYCTILCYEKYDIYIYIYIYILIYMYIIYYSPYYVYYKLNS